MRNKLTSRMLAALLAVVMVVGLLPMTALAARVIRDDAPMAEAAMGEEAVTTPVHAPSKAAEAAETEEGESAPKLVTVAKAALGTNATFGGDQVALSNALYTFAASGTGYTISATVPGTETTVYLNIEGGTNTLPNMISANGTSVGLTERTDSNSNKWFELRDVCSLHFHRGASELYFNRCKDVTADDMPNHYFALFRAATKDDTSSGDIPGYVRLTALNEVTSGGAYLIAAKVSDNWYVLYPTTSNDKYAHVAKVVLVEEEVTEPEQPETPVEKPRHYFAKAAAGANPWTIISDGTGLPNTLSYYVSATSYPEVTTLDASKPHRIYASSEGASGNGFLNVTSIDKGEALVATPGVGHPSNTMVTFEAQDNGAYLLSVVKDSTTYYLTATTKTYNGKECAVFSKKEADAVPYFVEYDEGSRIFCVGPYTVSFDGEGAADIADVEAMYGQKLALPTPTREGYTFQGWFVGEEEFTAETEVTADVTLTAQWEEEPEPEVPGKEAPPTELETVIEYRLAEGTLAEGVYAIVGSTAEAGQTPRSMHYWTDTRTVLDQCASGVPAGAETVSFSDIATNHLWNVTRTAEGKYTFAAVAAEGNYITGGAGTLSRGTTATEFTVVARSDGGHDLSWVSDGTTYYMAWDSGSRWYGATDQYRINLYKEGNAPSAMAQTVFTGTSNRPMDPDNPDSYYRIPSLVTLQNGWLMATSDIRWYTTFDSPNNLDTIVSISKDGGENWEYEVVNYFADYAVPNKNLQTTYGATKGGSASFIDPAVVQSEKDGSIYLLVDAQAPYVNGGKIGNGFDNKGRLKISKSPVNGNYSMDNVHDNNLHGYTFDYYVDLYATDDVTTNDGADYTVDGETVKLWPICANSGDHATGYYVDAFFNTYYDYDEGGMKAVIAQQHDSSAFIHNNIFYTQSEWKVFPTAFIMVRKAKVNEATGKLDWGEPTLLNGQIKHDNEHFIGVCPGRGITTTVTKDGEEVERIIFALYDNQTGNELASTIYSDDGGATWTRGEHTPDVATNNTGKTSESQIVELPDGNGGTFLRMYSRNGRPTISYADSYDGGATWSVSQLDNALNANNQNGQGCMVSFINLKGYLVDPDGTIYENLILTSYPQGTANGGTAKRTNGTIRIGYYDPADGSGPAHWLNEEKTWYAGSYIYSCLTQRLEGDAEGGAPSGNFALLYETDQGPAPNSAGQYFTDILFTTFNVTDILGEGWTLARELPAIPSVESTIVLEEGTASVIAEAGVLDLDMGATGALIATVTYTEGSDDGENAVVEWSSSDERVATVSTQTAQASLLSGEEVVNERAIITAVGPGRAVITATVTKNGVTSKASETEVVVQDKDNITVPDRYQNEVAAGDEEGTYTVSAEGLSAMIEAGGDAVKAADYAKTLALANTTYTDKAKADEAKAQIDEAAKNLYATLTGRAYYTIATIGDRSHTGEAIKPPVIVRKNGAIIAEGYTLEYVNNVDVGTATVNVKVGEDIVATGAFEILADDTQEIVDNSGSSIGSGSTGGSATRYPAPAEEDLEDLDVPLAGLPTTFVDVKLSDWFCGAAQFVFAKNLMQGVSATEFRPNMNTTRGMVVTILHRMEKEPEADPATFVDVDGAAWYGPAVAWGVESDVVKGTNDGGFHPTDDVTREQLALFLYRFAQHRGYDVSVRGELSGYADSETVSDWAAEAMSWAVGTGLITGKSGNALDPLSTATRAELATILTRFCKEFAAEK